MASRAILGFYEKETINDLADFNKSLWLSIKNSEPTPYSLVIENDRKVPLEFIIKLLIKIGFSAEDSAKLMMRFHKDGKLALANADKDTLLKLQQYIDTQSRTCSCQLSNKIIEHS